MSSHEYDDDMSSDALSTGKCESGYASGASTQSELPDIVFSKPHLRFINQQLQRLEPQEILRWCLMTLPGLYQTTAFGLSGLVTLDMLSRIGGPVKPSVDLIFLDTLHHFQETLDLVERVRKRYSHVNLHVYKPEGCETTDDFTDKYGERLWEMSEDLYDWIAKVEPARRAYADLQVKAVLTGRRRSQGGKRGDLDIIEVDDNGMVKVNPLANWSFKQVRGYVHQNSVPYNALLDGGYKSVGDWHSTQPITEGEEERSGRWKGRQKSECGIHNPKSKYAQFLRQQELDEQQEALTEALESLEVKA